MVILLLVASAEAGVVINEFLPNPNGTDTGHEWIELYNNGGTPVDISGWTIDRRSQVSWSVRYTVPGSTTIQPGAYLVIGDELVTGADLNLTGATLGMWGATTTGDAVRIADTNGTVDSVTYGPNNSDGIEDDAANQTVAPAPSEGDVLARTPNGSDTNDNGVDWKIATTVTMGADNDGVVATDTDTTPTDTDTTPTDTDTTPTDTDTSLPPSTGEVLINEFVPAVSGADDGNEWIELYNTTGTPIDLQGWQIERATSGGYGLRHTFNSVQIPANGYLTLGGEFVSGVDVNLSTGIYLGLGGGSNGDAVRIVDAVGDISDTVIYGPNNNQAFLDDDNIVGTAAPEPVDDVSLSRLPDGTDTNDSAVDFQLTASPTPGAANQAPPASCGDPATAGAELKINELHPNPAGSDTGLEWIELYNDGATAIDITGWGINTAGSSWGTADAIPPTTVIAAGAYLVIGTTAGPDIDLIVPGWTLGNASSTADGVRLEHCDGTPIDTVIYGSVSNGNPDGLVDDTGSAATSFAPKAPDGVSVRRVEDGLDSDLSGNDFILSTFNTPGLPNDTLPPDCGAPTAGIVINEFIPNPDGSDTEFEWLELYNGGSTPTDIVDWVIEKRTSTTWSEIYRFDSHTLAPGEYVLLGGIGVNNTFDTVSLGLGNAGTDSADAVRLNDCAGYAADTVVYGGANDDSIEDDSGSPATSLAPYAPSGLALARLSDGQDTDLSGDDFELVRFTTPGQDNNGPPVTCGGDLSMVKVNEFIADPDGSDTGKEWVELYNAGTIQQDLNGWALQKRTTSSWSDIYTFGPGEFLAPGDRMVLGGVDVRFAVDITTPIGLGSASSNADAVRLADCIGFPADTVVYGETNPDNIEDDTLMVATSLAAKPESGRAHARITDGLDTNASADDFHLVTFHTAGLPNDGPPATCGGPDSGVKINEFMVNPEGSDTGAEWIELFNAGEDDVDIGGWQLQKRSSTTWSEVLTFEAGTKLRSGRFVLVGGELVPGTDFVPDKGTSEVAAIGMSNATSNSDAVRLTDCIGFPADTVVYGQPNDDSIEDDTLAPALGLAPTPPEGASLARIQDGYDTDDSKADFVIDDRPTPNKKNPEREPVVCEPSSGVVVLNELMANPASTDEGYEWIELYNNSVKPVSVAGWSISAADSGDYDNIDVVLPGGAEIPANGFYLIGEEFVLDTDFRAPLSLGNGSDGDGMRLFDCAGNPVDTVVYGDETNPLPDPDGDRMVDDNGKVVEFPVEKPGDDESVARLEDGVDTDEMTDWFLDARPTPGRSNVHEPTKDSDPIPQSGCGCGNGSGEAPDGEIPPEGEPPQAPNTKTSSCATAPLPFGGFELLIALVALRRRRGVLF